MLLCAKNITKGITIVPYQINLKNFSIYSLSDETEFDKTDIETLSY